MGKEEEEEEKEGGEGSGWDGIGMESEVRYIIYMCDLIGSDRYALN